MAASVRSSPDGKALRKNVPRGSRAPWKPSRNRPDPIAMIEASNQGRLADLIPVRYQRMQQSAFNFLRGTADIMAFDLGTGRPTTGIHVQACGDCHLENFGVFATPERNVIFDINDFDESAVAPWEWDVERLAVSIQVAGRVNESSAKQNARAVSGAISAYRKQLASCAAMTHLEAWYLRIDATEFLAGVPRVAPDDSHEIVAQEYTVGSGLGTRLADSPPKLFHPPPDRQAIVDARDVFEKYERSLRDDVRVLFGEYELLDVAVKVVGVGSVGTRCGVGLFMAGEEDKLVLQIKEARASALEPYGAYCKFGNNGERVVAGQRLMQSASDILLGWSAAEDGHQYYIRQIADAKWSPDVTSMDAEDLQTFSALCGRVLAIAHSRSGNARAIAAYLGTSTRFDEAIVEFAESYSDQVYADYEAFLAALDDGRM